MRILAIVSILSFVFAFSCTEPSQKPISESSIKDSTAQMLTNRVEGLMQLPDSIMWKVSKDSCHKSHKQILVVKSFSVIHGNYIKDSISAPQTERYILLRGVPSTGSCKYLKYAYLHFVDNKKLLKSLSFNLVKVNNSPKYAELRLYFLENYYESILLKLLNSKKIYCWRGEYNGGHVWADVGTDIIIQ